MMSVVALTDISPFAFSVSGEGRGQVALNGALPLPPPPPLLLGHAAAVGGRSCGNGERATVALGIPRFQNLLESKETSLEPSRVTT